jgi:tetratricopeptide (TPR) repeat protein
VPFEELALSELALSFPSKDKTAKRRLKEIKERTRSEARNEAIEAKAAAMVPAAAPHPEAAAWSQRAMEWSHQASRHARLDRMEESVAAYHQALDLYETSNGVIPLCNAGSCWRNLGAIHRKGKNAARAVDSWTRAEAMYRNCREQVLTLRLGQNPSDRVESQPALGENVVSLDSYLVETLQTRSSLHMRTEKQHRESIDCHEEVVDLLLDLDRSRDCGWNVRVTEVLGTVVFGPMDLDKQTEALVVSLESLGTLYTSTGAYEDGLAAFEEALKLLRARQDEDPNNPLLVLPMAKILHSLSDLYLGREEIHRAEDALQDALNLQLLHGGELPPLGMLEAMDRLGEAHERREDFDSAMASYERVLLTRNQILGDLHVDVAKSLINVARVMELQGNDEGSLDIYRAAQAIYTRQVTSSEFKVASEDVQSLLRLVPNVMAQGRYEEAVSYLSKCLETSTENLDKTQLYFDLGQAYIGMGDYVSATVCLLECAKQDGAVSDEQIDQLLTHVEFLKREEQAASDRSQLSLDGSRSEEENENDESRSENDNRSQASRTEKSRVPPSIADSEDEEVVEQLTVIDGLEDHLKERLPLSPQKQAREQANATPLTAEFSRSASKGEQPSLDDSFQWENENAEDVPRTPSRTRPEATPSSPSELSSSSAFTDSERVASPVHSLSPVEPQTTESERNSLPTSEPSDDEEGEPIVEALKEWRAAAENSRTSETRALLDASDMEEDTTLSKWQIKKSRSRSRSISSPRGKKIASPLRRIESKGSDTSKGKHRFRRPRRKGFETLEEEDKPTQSEPDQPGSAAVEQLQRENEYHLDDSSHVDIHAPVRVIEMEPNWDEISEISFNLHGSSSPWKRTNEWWWGSSAEGLGRWFPSNFVSQAVEAADGFLSAKAIHNKVKSAPLHVSEEEFSTDERESQPTMDHASHLGVTDRKQSQYTNSVDESRELADSANGNLNAMVAASSPGRRRKKQDVLSDIRECSQQIAEQRMNLDETDPALGESLFRLALLHSHNQNIGSAMEAATTALRIQKVNSNFEVATRTLHFLAGLQLHERQYKSALGYYSEALRLETNMYGKYCESCAKTLNAIGTVRSLQNEFKLAMESHKEALNVLKECHGEDLQGNPLVSQTLCQIGAVYYRERNALSSIKSKTGDYTTFIEAGMLEVIGRAHEERGSYKMAIAFFEEKLQFLEVAPEGEAARDELATTLNSLGMLSSRAGLFMEAVDYYERALTLQMKIENDVVYASTAKVLTATVQFQLGFWHKALQLLREALPILERELGEKHETVAATIYHIGVTQSALCDYNGAMSSFSHAYNIQEKLLGVAHPATLRTRREMGNMYATYKTELDYSFEIFSEVLSAQQHIHGMKHPNIAETLHSIGCAYARKGADSVALKTLEECYYMRVSKTIEPW